jgi:S-DNA-T family DNA segregation ATPase FtsK/SpoIIIE
MPATRQARRNPNRRMRSSAKQLPIKHGLRELVLIGFCFVALYLFASLVTYYGGDPGWLRSGPVEEIRNKGGIVGAVFADLFFYMFGYFAYLFPIMVGYIGWLIYRGRHREILAEPKSLIVPGIGFVLTLSAGCGLAIVHFMAESALLPTHAGGMLGMWIGDGLVSIVDRLGATLILLTIFFTGITLLTGLSWLKLMDTLGYHTLERWPFVKKYMSTQFLPWLIEYLKQGVQMTKSLFKISGSKVFQWTKTGYTRWQTRRAEWRKEREQYDYDDDYDDEYDDEDDDEFVKPVSSSDKAVLPQDDQQDVRQTVSPAISKTPQALILSENLETPEPMPPESNPVPATQALLPALNLLEPAPQFTSSPNLKMLSQRFKEAFASLQVEVEVNAVHPGPVLTKYEIHPITPINTNHLTELSEALAKVLIVQKVRTLENKPGLLDIEVPNLKRQAIYLSALLNTPEYENHPSSLPVALGQDIGGQPIVVDLTRIPHILIAGIDEHEKTTAINTLILSLLYKATPETVRFLLIDSNAFSVYSDLPHLLVPIVTNMAHTTPTLEWCVQEMERRYRIMASINTRNIEDYNQALQLQEQDWSEEEAQNNAPLYYIIVIINELADILTNAVEQEAEKHITKLTQKARAAGIHIILGTQHPTVNVITGLIKANIPTRMAFQVNNKSESRTILGQMGAEMLLGQGDMLYMTAGTGMPVRIHGSSVSDIEVEKVVSDLKNRASPDYVNI